MKQIVSPAPAVLGLVALVASAGSAAAQRAARSAPAGCDTAGARMGLATAAAYGRPVAGARPSGVRTRHAVLGPGGVPTGGALARGRRVLKDGGGEAVVKDRRPVAARKESPAACPQLATTSGRGVGEVTGEMPALPSTSSAPGEVLPSPQLLGSVGRRGPRFFLPPILGGALLGGSAIALANRPRGGSGESPFVPVTPVLPGTPVVPTTPAPTPSTPPGVPSSPPTTPTSPTTPLVPPTPGVPTTPVLPTETVPEPETVVLLAGGLAVLGGAARRQRTRR